jgi:hypothetical protein
MKMKIIGSLAVGILIGILIGVLAHHIWIERTSTSRHWCAVKTYLAYIRDPSHAKRDPQSGLSYVNAPSDAPEPHLAALVAAGELQYLDIVLPTVPSTDRAAVQHWMTFCEQHPDDIVYSCGNPSSVFPTKGQQPLHLNIWFPESSQPIVQQLISELQQMGTKEKPTAH